MLNKKFNVTFCYFYKCIHNKKFTLVVACSAPNHACISLLYDQELVNLGGFVRTGFSQNTESFSLFWDTKLTFWESFSLWWLAKFSHRIGGNELQYVQQDEVLERFGTATGVPNRVNLLFWWQIAESQMWICTQIAG